MTTIPRNEILGGRAPESQPEGAAKAAQGLDKLRLQTEIQQQVRERVLEEKLPIINETEDGLRAASESFLRQHPDVKVDVPDFYRVAA